MPSGVGVWCVVETFLVLFLFVDQLIERAGRPPEDEKPETTDGWDELGLVRSSPKLLQKGIEGVVMKQIAAATKKCA